MTWPDHVVTLPPHWRLNRSSFPWRLTRRSEDGLTISSYGPDDVLSVRDVADMYCLCCSAIHRRIQRNRLKAHKFLFNGCETYGIYAADALRIPATLPQYERTPEYRARMSQMMREMRAARPWGTKKIKKVKQ